MKKTNQDLIIIDPDSEKRKFYRSLTESLLHASIYIDDVLEELENYERESAEDNPKKSFLVISLGPNQSPLLDFYNLSSMIKLVENVEIAQEVSTGLIMAYPKEVLLPSVDGHHHLIGPVILFDCDEDGAVVSVTAEDYDSAKVFYSSGKESLEIRNVSVPAIKVHLAGDHITCQPKEETSP